MISINEAKRLVKRAILANIVCDKPNLAITPLISGKHGIGKSAMIKSIAKELGGALLLVDTNDPETDMNIGENVSGIESDQMRLLPVLLQLGDKGPLRHLATDVALIEHIGLKRTVEEVALQRA